VKKIILNKYWNEYQIKFDIFNIVFPIKENIEILSESYYINHKDKIDQFIKDFKNEKLLHDDVNTLDNIKNLFINYKNQINNFIIKKENDMINSYEKYYNFAIFWNLNYNSKINNTTSFSTEQIRNKSINNWKLYYNSTEEIRKQFEIGKSKNTRNIDTFMSNYQLLLHNSKELYKKYSFYNYYYALPIRPDQANT
jgi:hypothetical protein